MLFRSAEKKRAYSAARLLEGVANWLQGKDWQAEHSLKELLPELGIKKPPFYLDDAVHYLESLREQRQEYRND